MTEYDEIILKQFIKKSTGFGETINKIIAWCFKVLTSKLFLILGCVVFGIFWFIIGASKKK
jgi:hypothetical protein